MRPSMRTEANLFSQVRPATLTSQSPLTIRWANLRLNTSPPPGTPVFDLFDPSNTLMDLQDTYLRQYGLPNIHDGIVYNGGNFRNGNINLFDPERCLREVYDGKSYYNGTVMDCPDDVLLDIEHVGSTNDCVLNWYPDAVPYFLKLKAALAKRNPHVRTGLYDTLDSRAMTGSFGINASAPSVTGRFADISPFGREWAARYSQRQVTGFGSGFNSNCQPNAYRVNFDDASYIPLIQPNEISGVRPVGLAPGIDTWNRYIIPQFNHLLTRRCSLVWMWTVVDVTAGEDEFDQLISWQNSLQDELIALEATYT